MEKAVNRSETPHRTLKVDNKGRSPLNERINEVKNELLTLKLLRENIEGEIDH